MKIVFLDIDGVLAHYDGGLREYDLLSPKSCKKFNRLFDTIPHAKIVISSSWRKFDSIAIIQSKFIACGFLHSDKIIDVTPICYGPNGGSYIDRGIEISTWIKHHPECTQYVILDDDNIGGLYDHFILIKNGMFTGGITEEQIDKSIEILNRD